MNINALNVIHKLDLLKTLLSSDNRLLFEKTITCFINDVNSDISEKSYYEEVLKDYQGNNFSAATDFIESVRTVMLSTIFSNPCDKKWEELTPTNEDNVRFCIDCKRNVFKVYNKQEYRKRKQLNQCVAISFHLNEVFDNSTGCEINEHKMIELLGSPSTIDE